MVLATDGLWDVLSSQRVAQIITNSFVQSLGSPRQKYTLAAQEVVMQARGMLAVPASQVQQQQQQQRVGPTPRGWRMPTGQPASGDDISCFIIPLHRAVHGRMNGALDPSPPLFAGADPLRTAPAPATSVSAAAFETFPPWVNGSTRDAFATIPRVKTTYGSHQDGEGGSSGRANPELEELLEAIRKSSLPLDKSQLVDGGGKQDMVAGGGGGEASAETAAAATVASTTDERVESSRGFQKPVTPAQLPISSSAASSVATASSVYAATSVTTPGSSVSNATSDSPSILTSEDFIPAIAAHSLVSASSTMSTATTTTTTTATTSSSFSSLGSVPVPPLSQEVATSPQVVDVCLEKDSRCEERVPSTEDTDVHMESVDLDEFTSNEPMQLQRDQPESQQLSLISESPEGTETSVGRPGGSSNIPSSIDLELLSDSALAEP